LIIGYIQDMNRLLIRILATVGLLGFTLHAMAQYAYVTTSRVDSPDTPQLLAINTVTNTVVGVVSLGLKGAPGGVALNPAGTRAYVAVTSRGTVYVVDTATNTVVTTVGVGACPLGIVVNPAGTRAYVANVCSGSVSVIDTVQNVVSAVVYGVGPPSGIAINPAGTRVYVTSPGGSLSVIDTVTNTVTAYVNVGAGSYGVVVNPAGTRAYVTVGVSGSLPGPAKDTVSVIDTTSNTVVATITGLVGPKGIAINPAGTRVYVANGDGNTVTVIDTATNTTSGSVTMGSNTASRPSTLLKPYGVSVSPAGTRAYVTNYFSNIVSVIDTSTNTVVGSVNMGVSYAPDLFGVAIGGPRISTSITAGGVVNSASYAAGRAVAPGSIASIFGVFPVSTASAVLVPLPTTLSTMAAQIDGVRVPLFFTSATQANIQVPWELLSKTSASVTASVGTESSIAQKVDLATFAPGIFTVNGTGQGQGIVVDGATGQLLSPSHPARAGSTVAVVYGTGLGPVTNQPATGTPASLTVLSRTLTPPVVTLGGLPMSVLFAGLAPGYVGLYQLNVQVPSNAPIGDSIPMVLSIGGENSNVVSIAVQR
jgi:uncharacterized protein (TIGR03437 family)